MSDFNPAFECLSRLEGGYSPSDNKRGAVNMGVTQYFLGLIHYPKQDPKDLTKEEVAEIFRRYFWDAFKLGRIEDQPLATAVFATVVNMLPIRAFSCLQRAAGVEVDGKIGPLTFAAVNSNPIEVHAKFCLEVESRYRELAAINPSLYGDDLDGWLQRVHELAKR